MKTRRAWFAALFAAGAVAQTVPPPQIPPCSNIDDQKLSGNPPKCPICGTSSDQPGLPVAVGNQYGEFHGDILPGSPLIICANPRCRIFFAVAR